MRKEADGAYQGHALQCHACAARDRKAKQHTAGAHDPYGLVFGVTRRDEELDG